ncbi:ATP-binding protein [Actinomadura rayongensis]|uniref:Tetratricopeptide repeat protein n=1 Tax=Actinomadura rayongensis TaxID=1429076 RepID=A0A6I4WDZ5_9ACTN|nr:tetratricopeptide repeat protein [Actinomadura rayongensis]MXQ67911.1 tetratricopeptide repeat protein [Actinomadura rayongensis]
MNRPSGDRDSQANEFTGDVTGSVVQARDVHGGLHVHPAATTRVPPRQLPGVGMVVDRDDVLDALDDACADAACVVVSGPAGIGKTAVALRWAHDHARDFPDGQLYADLRGHAPVAPAPPSEVLGGFIRALGERPETIPDGLAERAALYRSLTAGRRLLVVLDDAHSAAQVTPLLPGAATGAAVVTSRWRLGGLMARGARAVQIGPLDPAAATKLLVSRLGADRVNAEDGVAARLAELCAYSPLALSVATARLAIRPNWTLERMASALDEERRRLGVLSMPGTPDEDDAVTVRAALELSYRNLPEPIRRLYRVLGLYPGRTFDRYSAAALTARPVETVAEELEQLTDANLVDDSPDAHYRFHELTRLHALETADTDEPEPERAAAIRRLADWAVAATLAASRAAAPYRRLAVPTAGPGVPEAPRFEAPADALAWLEDELVNLRAIAQRAHETGLHRQAWLIVDAAWPLFLLRGHGDRRLDFDRLGLAAARAGRDRTAEAKMLNRTGLALRELGRLDEAARDFASASDIWRDLGNRARMAGADRRLGWVEHDRGDLGAARTRFRAALAAYRDLGEGRRVALTLCDLASVLVEDGQTAGAVAALREAGTLLESEADPYNRARVLVLLARAHLGDADPAVARDLADRALAAMRAIPSAVGEADALEVIGDLELRAGRTDAARDLFERARSALADAGAPTRAIDRRLAGPTNDPSA